MTPLDALNNEEKEAIETLRERMKKILSSDMQEDSLTLYRFLKARDFDVDKAEIMLRKNIIWRKAIQLEAKLESLEYFEVFKKYLTPTMLGYDKDGDMVAYVAAGNIEMKNLLKCMKLNDFVTHCNVFGERALTAMVKECEKTGRCNYQGTLILDLDNLTFGNATNRASAELFLRLTQILQDNYPERMKACYIINAPSYYVWVYSIVKMMMSRALINKIHVFAHNGWKEEFLKVMDPDVLPSFLGGKRTDPDGNPLCLDFICHGGKIPTMYYLTNEQRWFKDPSQVKRIVVLPMEKGKVLIKVEEPGSVIEWEFECKNKEIGFGFFFQELEKEVEVLPIHRKSTTDGTETGSYTAQEIGTYMAVFDNSYSWISSKEVRYCINVTKSKCI